MKNKKSNPIIPVSGFLAVTVGLFLLASCGRQSGALTFKTIKVEDFVKHPKGTEDDHGLKYKISFTYPANYSDKAVLKSLQQKFIRYTLENLTSGYDPDAKAKDYGALTPEKAVDELVADLKKSYLDAIRDESETDDSDFQLRTGWEFDINNEILFANDALLQLKTEAYVYLGGAHGSYGTSSYLFNLQTGVEYSRDDVFKSEAAADIRRLIINELLKIWTDSWDRDMMYDGIDYIWTEKTDFAVTSAGIQILYSDYEIGSYSMGAPVVVIPYAAIMPYLREGTPVWDVANQYATGAAR